MTTGAGDRLFLDTNVIVYANAAEAPLHEAALTAIQRAEAAGTGLWLSRQVLREYLATVTRSQAGFNPLPMATAIARVQYFQQQFSVAEDSAAVTARLLAVLAQVSVGGRQVHDANIVATMLAYGVPRLLTHNTADFARYSAFITVVPLVPGTV